jgi:hypothetical protein
MHMGTIGRFLALVLACAALHPGIASAATASVAVTTEHVTSKNFSYDETVARVTYHAGQGEANDLRVDRDGRVITFQDDGANVAPGEGCEAVNEHEVKCRADAERLERITVSAGDGDDWVRASVATQVILGPGNDRGAMDEFAPMSGGEGDDILTGADVSGGPGDDRLTGASLTGEEVDDFLFGGAGDDVLIGGTGGDHMQGGADSFTTGDAGPGAGAGRDRLYGGPGDDFLSDDDTVLTVNRDVLDGGAGRDSVSYESRRLAVFVDVARATTGGQAGESDSLLHLDGARGGSGPDVLRGGAGPSVLEGGGGPDRLDGRGGNDELRGDGGADRVVGGRGDDRLDGGEHADLVQAGPGRDIVAAAGDYFRDSVDCGAGPDTLDEADPWDVALGCEKVWRASPFGLIFESSTLRVSNGTTEIVYCVDAVEACGGRVYIHAVIDGRRRLVARGRFPARGRCSELCVSERLRLSRPACTALAEHGRLRALATTVLSPGRRFGAIPVREHVTLELQRTGARAGRC